MAPVPAQYCSLSYDWGVKNMALVGCEYNREHEYMAFCVSRPFDIVNWSADYDGSEVLMHPLACGSAVARCMSSALVASKLSQGPLWMLPCGAFKAQPVGEVLVEAPLAHRARGHAIAGALACWSRSAFPGASQVLLDRRVVMRFFGIKRGAGHAESKKASLKIVNQLQWIVEDERTRAFLANELTDHTCDAILQSLYHFRHLWSVSASKAQVKPGFRFFLFASEELYDFDWRLFGK